MKDKTLLFDWTALRHSVKSRQARQAKAKLPQSDSVKSGRQMLISQQCKAATELMNNKLLGLSPPGGLVSPYGGFVSLLYDQGLHFELIKLCQDSWMCTPGLSGVWDQNRVNSALYIAFWSVEPTYFKNVIVENIPPALSEDPEVKRPRNSKRWKFYYEKP